MHGARREGRCTGPSAATVLSGGGGCRERALARRPLPCPDRFRPPRGRLGTRNTSGSIGAIPSRAPSGGTGLRIWILARGIMPDAIRMPRFGARQGDPRRHPGRSNPASRSMPRFPRTETCRRRPLERLSTGKRVDVGVNCLFPAQEQPGSPPKAACGTGKCPVSSPERVAQCAIITHEALPAPDPAHQIKGLTPCGIFANPLARAIKTGPRVGSLDRKKGLTSEGAYASLPPRQQEGARLPRCQQEGARWTGESPASWRRRVSRVPQARNGRPSNGSRE
jgi:hypothetical protein